jgi:signal peptidase I
MDVMQERVTAYPELDELDEDDEKRPWSREIWFLLGIALVLALTLKAGLIQAFYIPSGSMEKTLHGCTDCEPPGDRVLVNKLVYRFRDIHRGEIVVFNGKGTNFTSPGEPPAPANGVQKVLQKIKSMIGFGSPGDKDFIKRVIGVPGDRVACCTDGKVTVNGQPIDEPYVYLSDPTPGQMKFDPVTVPKGELFLMGDHRDGSSDSRFNGPVPEDKVVGRAFMIFLPVKRVRVLRVPDTFTPKALDAPEPLPRNAPGPPPEAFGLVVPALGARPRRTKG